MIKRISIVAGLSLSLTAGSALAADWIGAVNSLRAQGCGVKAKVPALSHSSQLDAAARQLASGSTVEGALRQVGYAFSNSYALSIAGAGASPEAIGGIDGDGCRQLTAADLSQVGIYTQDASTWIVVAKPLQTPAPAAATETASAILRLVNKARATGRACGDLQFTAAPALRNNEVLSETARGHSSDMAEKNYFNHVAYDGSQPWDRARRAGYPASTVGENIAAGKEKADEVVAGWLASPAHCANLMNPAFREMGVGYGVNSGSQFGIYWTMVLGSGAETAKGRGRAPADQRAALLQSGS